MCVVIQVQFDIRKGVLYMRGKDITGKQINAFTVLGRTGRRDHRGCVIWHVRCECGKELDVSYSKLMYSDMVSCGCRKKRQHELLHTHLTNVDGTILEHIRDHAARSDNKTGVRGVFLRKGKYVAQIGIKGKNWYLGTYDDLQTAVQARRMAEQEIYEPFLEHYSKWKEYSARDPVWARDNPVQYHVSRRQDGNMEIQMEPVFPDVGRQKRQEAIQKALSETISEVLPRGMLPEAIPKASDSLMQVT